jgi:hypothetical protein
MAFDREFWERIFASADLVRAAPAWTQAGIVLSNNFDGGVTVAPCRHCNGSGKEYRWKDGRDGT